ncbi:unnamed protein product [Lactuca virosa]|uniref:Pentacotripeptide-repeat region of PRORP domain-containing protein n=1 Tax=Lactuca virosa TaxID=75947 RepID=A0AAU9N5M6_9ASTR|nr:unnamed protein product [Lactuca virosa]
MRRIHHALVALSWFRSPSPLVPQNIIPTSTLLQLHTLHISELISPTPTNESSLGIAHATVIKNAAITHLDVSNYLLSLYVKFRNLTLAHQLFDEIPQRDVRSWTILISGFSRIGSHNLALGLFTQMQKERITPNQFTFSSVLKCCGSAKELNMGKTILGWILRKGVFLDTTLQNSILDFYVKCQAYDYATKFFELMTDKDTVSWNIMISALLKNKDIKKAEDLFLQLPNKDPASWNTIIDGNLQNGYEQRALQLLYQMVTNGTSFTHFTFSIALILASSLNHINLGKQIHGKLLRVGIHDSFIKNSLLDMYSKCGEMEKAMIIFKTSEVDFVSLSSIVSGYIQNGKIEDGLKVFTFMVHEHGEIDKFTLASILSGCSDSGLLDLGQLIHTYVLKTGHEDVFLSSSMIDMYAKCGKLQCSLLVFKESKIRNVVLWTSIISSFASHGEGKETIRLFEMMRNEGVEPNEITFLGILTACSYQGLVKEGCDYFMLMKDFHGIKPEVEHYTCMVDLLGRGDLEMAKWVCEKLCEVEPLESGGYVLMSNKCVNDCRWEEVARIKGLMQEKGIKKKPGQSWIQ